MHSTDEEIPAGSVDPMTLRRVCGLFVTGVTVVTSSDGNEPVGLTVNSFTSVSLDPPLVLFCLHRESTVRRAIQASGHFTVNILADGQHDISRVFATRGAPRFDAVRHTAGSNGTPVLSDALAHVCCRLVDELDGGDHVIVLGQATQVGILRDGDSPLTFFRGSIRSLAA
jgi:flavin reductase (DIM6/NTAB) family NADH-FMN oxidoreductase RutF